MHLLNTQFVWPKNWLNELNKNVETFCFLDEGCHIYCGNSLNTKLLYFHHRKPQTVNRCPSPIKVVKCSVLIWCYQGRLKHLSLLVAATSTELNKMFTIVAKIFYNYTIKRAVLTLKINSIKRRNDGKGAPHLIQRKSPSPKSTMKSVIRFPKRVKSQKCAGK